MADGLKCFMVIEKGPNGDPSGVKPHGLRYFSVVPRLGETLSISHGDDDVQAYVVIEILHPALRDKDDYGSNSGDIYVKHIGSELEFRSGVNHGSKS